MPTYVFACQNPECEDVREENLPIDQREMPLAEGCPSCGGAVKRLYHAPAMLGAGLGDIL